MRLFVRDDGEDLASLAVEIGRGLAGALIFALPMLMTMEMWALGFTMSPARLAVFVAAFLPVLVGLSRIAGLRPTHGLADDVADALVAILIGAVASAALLWLFGTIGAGTAPQTAVGMVAVQTVPAAIGAMLARSQLGDQDEQDAEDPGRRAPSWRRELFEMAIGALFLSLNVAPTEEMVLIAHQMAPETIAALAALSLGLMHGIVYAVGFSGRARRRPGVGFASLFVRFTLAGYAVVLAVSLFLLWVFGRTTDTAPAEIAAFAVVLAFPGAIGAAIARLVL